MLKAVLPLAILLTVGASKAAQPEDRAVLMVWTLTVHDNNDEKHEYAVSPDGGTIKVDTGDWKCSYEPVTRKTVAGMYAERSAVTCKAGKYEVGSVITCGPLSVMHGPKDLALTIGSGPKFDLITLTCDPQN
jgi:hypothetical protein